MAETTDPQSLLPLSNLVFEVLVSLADQDRHGYGIIKDIEQRTQGALSVRSGALYTVIQRLLESGLVQTAPTPEGEDAVDARRKYYSITGLGREVAALEGARLAQMVAAARSRHLISEREIHP